MKPLMSRTEDSGALKDLGRASFQIVHDLKNQLNGLKLYATFLRKRIEKNERPDDELETINKLIGGLDRAAIDLTTITEYTREIELKRLAGFDLRKTLRGICSDLNSDPTPVTFEAQEQQLSGDFDPLKLTDALRWISIGVIKHQSNGDGSVSIVIARQNETTEVAVIEWRGFANWDHDPFKSFAGTDEIRMSLALKIIEAHGGTAGIKEKVVTVTLPLETERSESMS